MLLYIESINEYQSYRARFVFQNISYLVFGGAGRLATRTLSQFAPRTRMQSSHNLLVAPPPAVHANIASASSADPQAFNLATSTAGALSAMACATLTSSGEPLSSMAPTHLPSETQNAASLGPKSPTVTTSPF